MPEGNILVGGYGPNGKSVKRDNLDGTIHDSFGLNTSGVVFAMARQSDGRIIAAVADGGYSNKAKLSAGLALQKDGGLLIGGQFSQTTEFHPQPSLARLRNDGAAGAIANNATMVIRVREGTCPELLSAIFELSKDDGATRTQLGNATRVEGSSNWILSGMNLRSNGLIRGGGLTHRGGWWSICNHTQCRARSLNSKLIC